VSRLLELNGFIPLVATNGNDALRLFDEADPALVILDVIMPGKTGLDVCREIRARSDAPVIMLTALDDEAEAARALREGADDYVRKPFGARELMARIQAVLRRAGAQAAAGAQRLEAGRLVIDEAGHTVLVDGREVLLSKTEFAVLAYLMRNKDRVLTHDQMLERVWGPDYTGSNHVLQVAISRLRQKIDNAVQIEAVAGVGYRLRAP
jgi:two-component system response regulator RegX3